MNSVSGVNDKLSLVFRALADPTRRRMLEMLQSGECTLSQLAEPFVMTMPAVLKHLKVLSDAGLIDQNKTGRVRHCRLEEGPIVDATVWLSRQSKYWQNQFEILATFLSMNSDNKLKQGEENEQRIKEHPNRTTSTPNRRFTKKNNRSQKSSRSRKSN